MTEEQDIKETEFRYSTPVEDFPAPMRKEAFYGIAGEIINLIAPNTEACEEALLTQFLVSFGNLIGRNATIHQSGDHYCNEFLAIVGDTARGRKGTSWNAIYPLLITLDKDWTCERNISGLQTGEAVVNSVRDSTITTTKDGEVVVDAGVTDKRMLINESELVRIFHVASRNGSTMSSILREAFDSHLVLATNSKTSPAKATGAHISMLGHITKSDLDVCLKAQDIGNGFANRFLWIGATSRREIPRPKQIKWTGKETEHITKHLKACLETFKTERTMEYSSEGGERWDEVYKDERAKLKKQSGLAGKMFSRHDVHLLRLAMIYAALDNAKGLTEKHIDAALAVWEYSKRTIRWLFSASTGDRVADKILWTLRTHPRGFTRGQISEDILGNRVDAPTVLKALTLLRESGLAGFAINGRYTNNKPIEQWFAMEHKSAVFVPEVSL